MLLLHQTGARSYQRGARSSAGSFQPSCTLSPSIVSELRNGGARGGLSRHPEPGFCRCSHALERKDAAPLREAEGELLAASREERKWRVGRRAGDEHDPPSEEEA